MLLEMVTLVAGTMEWSYVLLEKGALIGAMHKDNHSPRHLAVDREYNDIVQILRNNAAELVYENIETFPPYMNRDRTNGCARF